MKDYPCKGLTYPSAIEAAEARHRSYEALGAIHQRDIWICLDGHFHEGVLV